MTKRHIVLLFLPFLLALPAAAQAVTPADPLVSLAETPGVSGYEERVTAWLSERLKPFHPKADNLGSVVVTLGAGAPHRLLVASIDEPGYVVSAITPEGYLRVERLPQSAPHPWFDLLHSAQPVVILTRSGEVVPGVVAGLSTHLQPGRESPAENRTDRLDRLYIDVGARSAEEVRALGVDVLDPLTLEKHPYWLANRELTAPFLSDRAGAAALVRLVEGIDPTQLKGTLSVAFVVRHYIGNQGLDRLLRQVKAEEVIFVQRLEKSDVQPGIGVPESGVVVANFEGGEPALAAELLAVGRQHNIPLWAELAQPAPRGRYTGLLPLPARAAVVGVPVKFPQTPGEVVSTEQLTRSVELLALYLGVSLKPEPGAGVGGGGYGGVTHRGVEDYLRDLIPVYGVSGYEQPVAELIRGMLPADWRERATTDPSGNLILTFGRPSAKPRLVFIAHMDEIGWVVKEIRDDGRVVLERKGGFLEEHFLGHPVLIHTKISDSPAVWKDVPGVLELPDDYRTKRYELVRARDYVAYVGAHNAAEAEALGIRLGDSVTVPKQYRKLAATRASARSFDDRVGSAALVAAFGQLSRRLVPGEPLLDKIDREVVFVWSVREEVGLEGAKEYAARAAEEGQAPNVVFAVDTFVSSDSPLESPRFANARLGEGFVVRAVDNSNVVPRTLVDRVVKIARQNNIPVQYGVTGGGNDGAAVVPYGAVDIALGWPLRYSHSAAEVVDLKDVQALADIVAALAQAF